MESDQPQSRWLDALNTEDLAFIKRFVLASGSLKKVAGEYGISYPTVRLRLNRLIEKVHLNDDRTIGEFERSLRILFAEGKIDAGAMATLLQAHKKESKESPQ